MKTKMPRVKSSTNNEATLCLVHFHFLEAKSRFLCYSPYNYHHEDLGQYIACLYCSDLLSVSKAAGLYPCTSLYMYLYLLGYTIICWPGYDGSYGGLTIP